jgi:hypothetical protein
MVNGQWLAKFLSLVLVINLANRVLFTIHHSRYYYNLSLFSISRTVFDLKMHGAG